MQRVNCNAKRRAVGTNRMSESCCSSLPNLPFSSLWSPALHNPSFTGMFFLPHHQTHNSYLSKQIPGLLEKSTVLGDFSQTKHICVPLMALVLHANANRLFKWHRMWSSNSWWAKIKFNLKNAFKLCAFSGHTYLYDYTRWEAVRKLQVLLHLLVMTDTK